jgi:TPR repeat protein
MMIILDGSGNGCLFEECSAELHPDPKEAARYFKLLADEGNLFAQKNYAQLCRPSDDAGVTRNAEAAAKYYWYSYAPRYGYDSFTGIRGREKVLLIT